MGKVAPLVAVMVAMVNDGVGGDGDDGLSLLRATLPAAEMIHRHLSHLRKIRLLRFNQ